MRPRQPAAVLALLLLPAAAAAQPAPGDAARAARLEWHRQEAARAAAEDEKTWVASATRPEEGKALGRLANPARIADDLKRALGDTKLAVGPKLDKLAETARARRAAAEKDWAAVFQNRAAFELHADAEQKRYGFDPVRFEPPLPQLLPLDVAVLSWALAAFLIGTYLAAHEYRVPARRRRRSRLALAGAAALVLLPAAGCGGPAAAVVPWETRETERLAAAARDAAAAADATRKETDAARAKDLEAWAAALAPNTPEGKDWADRVTRAEADTRKALWEVLHETRLAQRLADEAAAEREKLPADRDRLTDLVTASRFRAGVYTGVRVAAGAGFVALAFAPLVAARRRRRKWAAAEAQVCPRCLARNRLKVRTADAVDPRYPETNYLECDACGYRFRQSYARIPRLCFPTVGIRASGKTHMLVTAYDRVRNGTAPTSAALQQAPSIADQQFEAFIDLIVRSHGMAGATHHDLPNPIVIHARDKDPAGANTVLVNLFDYSGEMVQKTLDTDLLRQRAVLMDGFMMFLDPTQLYGEKGGIRLEDQIRAMNDFYQDMAEARRVGAGRAIPVPVAVCITKFDLLVTDNPMKWAAADYIRTLTDDLGPAGAVTLDVIARRSAVVEEMLPQMFQGFDLRKKFREFFGGQVMFFPISSVSLIEGELGVKDMKKRSVDPYGVVEPVLWLLHMHGYEVLGG